MENGLEVAASNDACGAGFPSGVCYVPASGGGGPQATGIVAFVAGDSTGTITAPSGTGSGLQSGVQQLALYGVRNSPVNVDDLTITSQLLGGYDSVHTSTLPGQAASEVRICVVSSTTHESGLFTIDAGLHVTLSTKGNLTCA